MKLPLADVKVVDLTFNISGPYATMILGDLGADVLKVERPGGGDDARRMAPSRGAGSAYFFAVNRNKRSVELDFKDPADRARLREHIAGCDVFVTNARALKLREVGLDADAVGREFPSVIYADISGYGADGPHTDRPGYDMVLQARSGLMSVTGEPGRPPVRVGVSILDMGAGLWLALGVLAGLRSRERSGRGGRVSTSLLEVGAAYMAYDLAAFELTGTIPEPRGSGHPAFAPYGIFRAADGYLAVGVGSDRLFARLASVLDRPDWVTDPRFATNEDRVANRAELTAEIDEALSSSTAGAWAERLQGAGVPADRTADVRDLLEDVQLAASDAWLDVPVGDGSTLRQPGLPIRMDGRRPGIRRAPPRPGQHNADVLPAEGRPSR